MTRKGKLMNLRQMKIKTVRVNIKQEEKKEIDFLLFRIEWIHFLHGIQCLLALGCCFFSFPN